MWSDFPCWWLGGRTRKLWVWPQCGPCAQDHKQRCATPVLGSALFFYRAPRPLSLFLLQGNGKGKALRRGHGRMC